MVYIAGVSRTALPEAAPCFVATTPPVPEPFFLSVVSMTDTPRRTRDVNPDAWDSKLSSSSIPKSPNRVSCVYALSKPSVSARSRKARMCFRSTAPPPTTCGIAIP